MHPYYGLCCSRPVVELVVDQEIELSQHLDLCSVAVPSGRCEQMEAVATDVVPGLELLSRRNSAVVVFLLEDCDVRVNTQTGHSSHQSVVRYDNLECVLDLYIELSLGDHLSCGRYHWALVMGYEPSFPLWGFVGCRGTSRWDIVPRSGRISMLFGI